jgi:Phasin protein
LFSIQGKIRGNMTTKRRGTPKRRQAKIATFHQTAPPRKRSKRKAELPHKAGAGQEALQPGVFQATVEKASEATGNTLQEDVWSLGTKMANQFAEGAMEPYTRAFSIFMLPLGKQQAEVLSRLPGRALSPNGVQAITRELINHLAQQVHLNFQAVNALTTSRSPLDLLRAQSDLAKGTFESIVQTASRISLIATRMATEAGRPS